LIISEMIKQKRDKKKSYAHKPAYAGMMRLVAIIITISFSIVKDSRADDSIEFNADVLDVKEKKNVNLSHFSRAGYLMPGEYSLTINVNKAEIPEQKIKFIVPDNDPNGSSACLTIEMVKLFGLKDDVLKKATWWHNNECLDVSSLEGITLRPDLGKNALYINVPQAYLEYTAEDWDPPARWEDGIPGLLFDYNVNAMSTKQSNSERDDSVSGNGTTGANIGPWRLRADWQAQYDHQKNQETQKNWDWSRYYAYRAITSLKAQLMIGENYLSSSLFDSFRFSGASLATDNQQLPPNLRGYAPEVVGVAKTNAKVTVSQQGRVIYETTVASGPFRIQDLNSSVSGTLDVKVEEQDGSVRTWQVETASIPYLTRPGMIRYKVAVGKPSDIDHHTQGPEFATSEFSWGINSSWSLYGGGLFAGNYNQAAVGIGRDLVDFGAIAFDVTRSRASLPNESDKSGNSYRVSYSKRFDDYNSEVTFAGYRFSERNFMNMTQYLDRRYNNGDNSGQNKELYTITINKQFPAINLSAFLNYSHQTYWDRATSNNLNLSISSFFDIGKFKNTSLSLSVFRNQSDGSNDDGVYVSLTLPWGENSTVSYNGQTSGGNTSHNMSYYQRIDSNNNYRLSAGVSNNGSGTGSGYFTHDGDIASLTANASVDGTDNKALGLSLQGGMTATAQGMALHRTTTSGGTRMLVDTDGISDVPIHGYGGLTHTNMFGKAVVSDITNYYRNNIGVDLDSLPVDMDATRSMVSGTLTEGAIGYRRFGIIAGKKAMVIIKLADGSAPPFGAEINNENGSQTGIVGDEGNTWLAGIRPGEMMQVSWDDGVQCRIVMPTPLPAQAQGLLLPCRPL